MPRTKVSVPDLAEAAPGLWSNAIRAGDMLFISGQVNIEKNTEVWRARREFFSGDFPASTLVEVRSLAKPEVLVEIETVAYLGKR